MENLLKELRELLTMELDLETQTEILKARKREVLERIGPKMKTDILSRDFCTITKDFRATVLSEEGVNKYCDLPLPKVNKRKIREAMDSGVDISADVKIVEFISVRKKRNGLDGFEEVS
jgi:hypothetical protein